MRCLTAVDGTLPLCGTTGPKILRFIALRVRDMDGMTRRFSIAPVGGWACTTWPAAWISSLNVLPLGGCTLEWRSRECWCGSCGDLVRVVAGDTGQREMHVEARARSRPIKTWCRTWMRPINPKKKLAAEDKKKGANFPQFQSPFFSIENAGMQRK
ncbi:UNVERIFIED_CONTAM: hypothetical protein B566_EDAN018565 [Ephemera danica]|nr:hypothetical protein B566_EDAN018565 [Ephemera danica]